MDETNPFVAAMKNLVPQGDASAKSAEPDNPFVQAMKNIGPTPVQDTNREIEVPKHLQNLLGTQTSWPQAAESVRKNFNLDPEQYRQSYKLAEARSVMSGQGVGTFEQLGRQGLPFVSPAIRQVLAQRYTDAKGRFDAGNATDEDIGTIANYERLQGVDQRMGSTFGGKLVQALGSGGEMIGEATAAGGLAGAAGKAAGIKAATTTAGKIGQFAGRQAATTPLMPSLYQQHVAETNIGEGRSASDPRALPTAAGLAYANNLVLGSLSKLSPAGTGLARRVATAAGAGALIEQPAVDVAGGIADEFLPKAYQTRTRYGTLGELARGDKGEAAQKIAIQMLTFGAFTALHGGQDAGHQAIADATAKLDAGAKKGQPLQTAAAEPLADLQTKTASLTPPAPEKAPESPPAAPIAEPAQKPVPQPEAQESTPGAEKPAPTNPLDALSKEEVGQLAKSLGFKSAKALQDRASEPWVRDIVNSTLESAGRAKLPSGPEKPVVGYLASEPEAVPAESLFRVPDYKGPVDNTDAAVKELLGPFQGKWFSKGDPGYPGHVQIEFRSDKLGGAGDAVENRHKEVGIGSTTPMYLHPALVRVRYRGPVGSEQGERLRQTIEAANEERAKQGIEPIKMEMPSANKKLSLEELLAEIDKNAPQEAAHVQSEARRNGISASEAQGLIGEVAHAAHHEVHGTPEALGGLGDASQPAPVHPGEPAAALDSGADHGEHILGRGTMIETVGMKPVPAQYAALELSRLHPSHSYRVGEVRPTEGYPEGLQPREYKHGSEEDAKVKRFAAEKKAALYLTDDPTPTGGPPSVTPEGVVLNGNGRAMSLQLAKRMNEFDWYKNAAVEQAGKFGLDSNAVRRMHNPVIVRVVNVDPHSEAARQFARAGNETNTQGQSPARRAASLASLIDEDVLTGMKLTGDETFSKLVSDPSKGKAFREKLYRALPPAARSEFFEEGGNRLTDAGRELVEQMMLSKLVPPRLVEELQSNRRQMLRSIEGAIPQLLALRKNFPDRDVSHQLREALGVLERNPNIKSVGDADNALSQLDLFSGKPADSISPGGRMMLDFLLEYGDRPREFRTKLTAMVKGEDANRGRLFEMAAPASVDPIENAAANLGVKARPGAKFGATGEAFPPAPERGPTVGGIPISRERGSLGIDTAPPPKQFAQAHAKVTEERAARGRDEVLKSAAVSDPHLWNEAQRMLHDDPDAAEKILSDVEATNRPITETEMMVLLNHRVALSNSYDTAVADYNRAAHSFHFEDGRTVRAASDAELKALRERMTNLEESRDRLDAITRQKIGAHAGRLLRLFRVLAAEDYSLAGLFGRARAAKGGKDLTEEERVKIEGHHKDITDADAELGKLEESRRGGKMVPDDKLRSAKIKSRKAKAGFEDTIRGMEKENLPAGWRAAGHATDTFNLIRALKTSYDLSAMFRQGFFFVLSHPIKAAGWAVKMLKALRSQAYADDVEQQILDRPKAPLYERAGLYLSKGTAQEEAFRGYQDSAIAKFANKFLISRGVLKGIEASERAYNTFLNVLRADLFDQFHDGLIGDRQGSDVELHAIANLLNVGTGRGSFNAKISGLDMEKAAAPLAHLFFSPRFLVSRFQLLAGQPLMQGTAGTRMLAAKEYARALGTLGLFYALLSVDDKAKIEHDPRSADFGKVRFGRTRLDPLAGLSQVAVFSTRVIDGETKTQKGKIVPIRDQGTKKSEKVPYGGQTVGDVVLRFMRSKLAPVPGAVADRLSGNTVGGQPVTTSGQTKDLLAPMVLSDVYGALEDQGWDRGSAISLLSILGMGAQTYEPKKK